MNYYNFNENNSKNIQRSGVFKMQNFLTTSTQKVVNKKHNKKNTFSSSNEEFFMDPCRGESKKILFYYQYQNFNNRYSSTTCKGLYQNPGRLISILKIFLLVLLFKTIHFSCSKLGQSAKERVR